MDNTSYQSGLTTDQLHMAGLVLGALEAGRIRMNARDYFDIASAATSELELMDTADLERASKRLAPALRTLIENVLFARRAIATPGCRRDQQVLP